MINLCEEIEFLEVDQGKNTQGALTWIMDSEAMLDPLFQRCRPYLPSSIKTVDGTSSDLMGLNARCRFYRYKPNSHDTFRPHRDDSSPGSGFTPGSQKQTMRFDAFDGTQTSFLTFLLYLNDDFDGGETTFFPGDELSRYMGKDLSSVTVQPRQGAVLCFPQTLKLRDQDKASALSPLHEGSRLYKRRASGESSRAKYVMRTDVLYSVEK